MSATSQHNNFNRSFVVKAFHDLAKLLAITSPRKADIRALETEMCCEETLGILSRMARGGSFCSSLCEVVGQETSNLRQLLFGSLTPCVDGGTTSPLLLASSGSHRLAFCFTQSDTGESLSGEPILKGLTGDSLLTVMVETNFSSFVFWKLVGGVAESEPFLHMSQDEIANEIGLTRSLWAIVFPSHRAILTRTTSVSVPRRSGAILFDAGSFASGHYSVRKAWKRRHAPKEYEALDRLRLVFGKAGKGEGRNARLMQLLSIEDVRRRLDEQSGKTARVLADITMGKCTVKRYCPPHSRILNFGEEVATGEPSRLDYVLTYKPAERAPEFHRDFIVSPDEWGSDDYELYRAVLDVQHTLAIRRSGLFRLGFARRVYTILLPPVVLQVQGTPEAGYLLVTCLILYQVPRGSSFRRTFTVSNIAVPISIDHAAEGDERTLVARAGSPRTAGIDELHDLLSDLKAPMAKGGTRPKFPCVTGAGPLVDLVGLPKGPMSVPELKQRILEFVVNTVLKSSGIRTLGSYLRSGERQRADDVSAIAFEAMLESRLSTMLVHVDWRTPPGDAQPWEKWLSTGEDNSLRDSIYKLMFYSDFLEPHSGYTSRGSVDLAGMLVGNKLRTDMNGMTFFDPSSELKLVIYPRLREHYPDYSIVRWMAFSLYAESALSALQDMIQRFYIDLGQQGDLGNMTETLDDMIQSFAELYDLDIRRYLYRQEYEQLREAAKVDHDYEFLLRKFSSVMDSASLREQRLINKLLVAFTVSTTTIGILSTVAAMQKWSLCRYLTVTVLVAIGLVIVAYGLFDPLRRVVSRTKPKARL